MRLFDWIGILAVGSWLLAFTAFFLVGHEGDPQAITLTDGAFELQEDTTWMAVYHAGDEVGVLREDRTRLVDGWLIENQGIAELSFGGDPYLFQFTSRVTLRDDLALRNATASIDAFGHTLEMLGQYTDDGPSFRVHLTLDEAAEQFRAPLDQRPRIAPHAIPQILAQHDPQPGDRFSQDYFDPMTLTPSTIDITYEGQREVSSLDGDYPDAHHFVQSTGGLETNIMVDEFGMPIQQVLPMQVAIARLPQPIGAQKFADLQERFDERGDTSPPFVDAIDAGDLLAIAARFGSGDLDRLQPDDLQDLDPGDDLHELLDTSSTDDADDDDDDPSPLTIAIDPLPERDLDLLSPRQHIALQSNDDARVQTAHPSPLWHTAHAPSPPEFESRWPDPDDAPPWFRDLVDAIPTDPDPLQSPDALRDAWPDTCPPWHHGLPSAPDNSAPSLDDVAPKEPYTCLSAQYQALLTADYHPHLVHGFILHPDRGFVPHLWIALYDGHQYLADIDPLAGPVDRHHLQLWLASEADLEALVPIADSLHVLD